MKDKLTRKLNIAGSNGMMKEEGDFLVFKIGLNIGGSGIINPDLPEKLG